MQACTLQELPFITARTCVISLALAAGCVYGNFRAFPGVFRCGEGVGRGGEGAPAFGYVKRGGGGGGRTPPVFDRTPRGSGKNTPTSWHSVLPSASFIFLRLRCELPSPTRLSSLGLPRSLAVPPRLAQCCWTKIQTRAPARFRALRRRANACRCCASATRQALYARHWEALHRARCRPRASGTSSLPMLCCNVRRARPLVSVRCCGLQN